MVVVHRRQTGPGCGPPHLHGDTPPGPQDPRTRPAAAEAFLEHLASYQEVAVKYVVAPAGFTFPKTPVSESLRLVFSDAVATIFELPHPRPYFEASVGECTLEPAGRERVRTSCPRAFTLVRRELFMPGWKAFADGETLRVEKGGELFQAVEIPAGTHVVRYRYVPPYFGAMLLAFASGVLVLVFAEARRRRTLAAP